MVNTFGLSFVIYKHWYANEIWTILQIVFKSFGANSPISHPVSRITIICPFSTNSPLFHRLVSVILLSPRLHRLQCLLICSAPARLPWIPPRPHWVPYSAYAPTSYTTVTDISAAFPLHRSLLVATHHDLFTYMLAPSLCRRFITGTVKIAMTLLRTGYVISLIMLFTRSVSEWVVLSLETIDRWQLLPDQV